MVEHQYLSIYLNALLCRYLSFYGKMEVPSELCEKS